MKNSNSSTTTLAEASSPVTEVDPIQQLEAYRNSPQGKQLVAWVLSEARKCESARTKEQLQWYRNLSLYEGKHDFRVGAPGSLAQDRLFQPPRQKGQAKKVINRIKPIVRTQISRLISQKPSSSAVPASSEDQDLFAAQAAEQILQSQYDKRNLRKAFTQAAFWISITGNGFIKTWWDPNLFDRYSQMPGDIDYGSVPPFNILVPDLRIQEIQEQPYVIHTYTKSVTWLQTFFAERLQGIKLQPSARSASTFLDEAYYKLQGSKESEPDSCVIREVWVKPGACLLMPQGGLVTLVDDNIVQITDQGIPYQHGDFPFTHFTDIPSATFYASSVIQDLEVLQLEYSSLRSQIAESREKMAKPQLLAPKGSISAAKVTNTVGLVIEYRPGMERPNPLPLTQLPQYIFEEQAQILSDMEDLSGQHQVSKGQTPPGVTAATAIGFLQEKDDTFLATTYGSIEYGWVSIGRQTLALAQQFWNVARTVKVVGEDGIFDVQSFSASDLVDGTDVRVEPGSALPESKSARIATLLDLMNMGHISSQDGLAMMEIGGVSKIVDNLQVDQRQAMRENLLMRKLTDEEIDKFDMIWQNLVQQGDMAAVDPQSGLPLEAPPVVPVNTWDNHEVHIEIHNRFRKSQQYAQLSQRVKATFETHVQHHQMAMQEAAMSQALMSIPSDGTDPTAMDAGDPQGALGIMPGSEPAQASSPSPGPENIASGSE